MTRNNVLKLRLRCVLRVSRTNGPLSSLLWDINLGDLIFLFKMFLLLFMTHIIISTLLSIA